ncbi:MAG: HD domain-containing protein [Holosporales bacterium]|jgi:putative nucleotidyltransferase with HDIG domain|nr:HD domain-containing protein [Holosporales bacterium]
MKEAIELFKSFLPENYSKDKQGENVYKHSLTVAFAAKTIAAKTENLDPKKAFLYGLMHDIGKFFLSKPEIYKHPRIGYELTKLKYPDIAEICVSHPFPNFALKSYFTQYCAGDAFEADRIEKALSGVKINDYIELIQLCDKLSGINDYMSLELKFKWYKDNYQIYEESFKANYKKLSEIKLKFDAAIKNNVYTLLGIKT